MIQRIKELSGFKIYTLDDQKASIKDFLFDSKSWIIQYVEAEFGNILISDRVLIPKVFFKNSRFENEQVFVEITKSFVNNCPKPSQHLPVHKKYEEFSKQNKVESHLSSNPASELGFGYNYDDKLNNENEMDIDENMLGTHLWSTNEIKDYKIRALDGTIGELSDLVIYAESWQIAYLMIDTKKWLPISKILLIDIAIVSKMNFIKKEIILNIYSDSVKDVPDLEFLRPLSEL